jgi:phosphatidylglycerophosphate synthase
MKTPGVEYFLISQTNDNIIIFSRRRKEFERARMNEWESHHAHDIDQQPPSTECCLPGCRFNSRRTEGFMSSLPVVLYVPNILCYARIVLAFVGLQFASTRPVTAVTIWIASATLDFFDGLLARVLNQTSSFGVVLDIAADNILRSCVWVAVAAANPSYLAVSCFVLCLEWTTMVSTQVHASSHSMHWKESRERDPWFVQSFFAANFRNPLGALGIFGLFAANLFAYGSQHPILVESIPLFNLWKNIAFIGRGVAMFVELWFCKGYVSYILEQDSKTKTSKSK